MCVAGHEFKYLLYPATMSLWDRDWDQLAGTFLFSGLLLYQYVLSEAAVSSLPFSLPHLLAPTVHRALVDPPKKPIVCLLCCFVLSPLISLGAVPHHHLALSVKELTYSSNSSSSLSFFPLTSSWVSIWSAEPTTLTKYAWAAKTHSVPVVCDCVCYRTYATDFSFPLHYKNMWYSVYALLYFAFVT